MVTEKCTTDNTLNMTSETKMSEINDDAGEMTWMDTNRRGQIVYRPRRFRGLTGREGFADYVEQAYWAAKRLGLLEALAALPSLEGKTVTEIAGLTRALGARIRERMWNFNDGYGPNLYYGALTRMVVAAKEDVRPTTGEDLGPTTQEAAAGAAAGVELHRRQTMGGVESTSPLPALPTSPLLRQKGVAAAADAGTVSDSEVEMGTAALRDVKHSIAASVAERKVRDDEEAEYDGDMVIRSAVAFRAHAEALLAERIAKATAAGWNDISGHPFVAPGAAFIRTVSGVADQAEEPPQPLVAEDGDGDRHSDEDSASVEDDDGGDGHEVTGIDGDSGSDSGSGGEDADTEGEDEDEDGEEADGEDTEPEDADARIQHVPAAPAPAAGADLRAILQQNIGIDLPLWAWLAILAAFTAWAAFVNMALSRDLGCRAFG